MNFAFSDSLPAARFQICPSQRAQLGQHDAQAVVFAALDYFRLGWVWRACRAPARLLQVHLGATCQVEGHASDHPAGKLLLTATSSSNASSRL